MTKKQKEKQSMPKSKNTKEKPTDKRDQKILSEKSNETQAISILDLTMDSRSLPKDLDSSISSALAKAEKSAFSVMTFGQKKVPDVNGLESYIYRDETRSDGALEEVFIDKEKNQFYLCSTFESMAGPEYSEVSWKGPFPLEKGEGKNPAL